MRNEPCSAFGRGCGGTIGPLGLCSTCGAIPSIGIGPLDRRPIPPSDIDLIPDLDPDPTGVEADSAADRYFDRT